MAMLFNLEPEDVVRLTNYDGESDKYPETLRARSHHPQELINAALQLGYAMIPIEPVMVSMNTFGQVIENENMMFSALMNNGKGLLLCARNGRRHFVAWDGSNIYDPLGYITTKDDSRYTWITFFLVRKLSE